MPSNYDIGDIVRVSSTFRDTGALRADPTSVKFVYTTPDGADTVATRTATATGDSNGITKVSTGVYYSDITATASGPYWYRFSSTGSITTAAEWNFRVRRRFTAT